MINKSGIFLSLPGLKEPLKVENMMQNMINTYVFVCMA